MKRKEGGRGLTCIQNSIHRQVNSVRENIEKRQKNEHILKIINLNNLNSTPIKDHFSAHIEKPLHGVYIKTNQFPCNTFLWLNKLNVRKDIESTIFSVQEQAYPTNNYKAKIEKKNCSSQGRFCQSAPETALHLLSSCSVLAKKDYIERHNKVGKIFYQAFCTVYSIPFNQKQTIAKISESRQIKLLWDFPITTNKLVTHNRPDLIVHNKTTNTAIIIDFSIPNDQNVLDKYNEKVTKYLPLAAEIKLLWSLNSVRVQPLIFGCLGTFTNRTKKEVVKLNIPINLAVVQSVILTEAVKIMKKLNYV